MNDARPSNRIRGLRALLSAIVPIIAGLGALAVVAQSEAPPTKTIPLHNAARLLGVDEAVAVKDPDLAKASHDLLVIHDEYQRHLQQAGAQTGGTPAFESSNALAGIVDGKVVIEAVATSDARALAAELEGLGLEDTAVSGWMVSGRLAISTIPALKDVVVSVDTAGKGIVVREVPGLTAPEEQP